MEQHCQIAGKSCQVVATVLSSKERYTDTPGKLGGYGKNATNRDNPQPSPNVSEETMDAVQRLNGSGG